jgi:hypothetical protein
MANLIISEKLLQALLDAAAREQRPVEAIAEQALNDYLQAVEETPTPQPATFAALAKSARDAKLSSPLPVNTAENSREILETEYADYIVQRMKDSMDAKNNPG